MRSPRNNVRYIQLDLHDQMMKNNIIKYVDTMYEHSHTKFLETTICEGTSSVAGGAKKEKPVKTERTRGGEQRRIEEDEKRVVLYV